MNKVELFGHLGGDPEIRYSQNGENSLAICRFSLGVRRKFAKEGEQNCDWVSCVAFANIAELIGKHFHKGSPIIIVGRIQTGSYTNKDGVKVYYTEVVIEDFDFVEKKSNSQSTPQQAPQQQQPVQQSPQQQTQQQQYAPQQPVQQTPQQPPQQGVPQEYSLQEGMEDELPFY